MLRAEEDKNLGAFVTSHMSSLDGGGVASASDDLIRGRFGPGCGGLSYYSRRADGVAGLDVQVAGETEAVWTARSNLPQSVTLRAEVRALGERVQTLELTVSTARAGHWLETLVAANPALSTLFGVRHKGSPAGEKPAPVAPPTGEKPAHQTPPTGEKPAHQNPPTEHGENHVPEAPPIGESAAHKDLPTGREKRESFIVEVTPMAGLG